MGRPPCASTLDATKRGKTSECDDLVKERAAVSGAERKIFPTS